MTSFERIKAAVTMRQAVEYYGIHVNRHGFACCPFHHEKTPSMKVDTRFHCFGCQADGDVIDFTARLFGLDLKDAADKLAADFGIDASLGGKPLPPVPARKTEQQAMKDSFNACWQLYCDYLHLLKRWKEELPPKSMDEDPDDRFVEALHNIDRVEYFLDELWDADDETRQTIIKNLQPDMERIAKKPELSRHRSHGGPSL